MGLVVARPATVVSLQIDAVADTPTRDAEITVERSSSRTVSKRKSPPPGEARHTITMATRSDDVAQVVRRRHETAERRRRLTHALHGHSDGAVQAANDDFASDYAITDRFVRISADELVEEAPASSLGHRVQILREQAAACRAQAIALNAKLVMLEADRSQLRGASGELHAVREQLIEGSARLDHAIDEVDAVARLERHLETF